MTILGEPFGIKPEPWQEEAACQYVDPELFFILKGQTTKVRQAKKICRSCPVVDQCREWAIEIGDRHAILGGTTERDRRHLRKARHAGGAAA